MSKSGAPVADETKWSEAVEGLRSSYSLGAPTGIALLPLLRRSLTLPDKVAREVVVQSLEFPAALVRVAESHCRQLDAERILPVGQVATDEGWFAK